MFASRVKKQVEFEDGSVTIRKLSYHSLEKAREARTAVQAASMRNFGGDVLKALRNEDLGEVAKRVAEQKPGPKEQAKARYAEYDRDSVLVAAIDSWTYGDVTPKAIYDLEEERAARLHREILDLSLPPLESAAAEEQQKNV